MPALSRVSLLCSLVWLAAGVQRVAAQGDSLTPGHWYHGEETNPFDDAQRSMYASIYPDSVTGVGSVLNSVPLRVICEDGKRIRINVLGPTPNVTDPGNALRTDYTVWHVRFSDGKIWRNEPASVYLSTTPGKGFVQAAGVEKEMTQRLIASRWVRIAYPTLYGEDLIAWYTLPADTESSVAQVYRFCKKILPGRRAATDTAAAATAPAPASGLLGHP